MVKKNEGTDDYVELPADTSQDPASVGHVETVKADLEAKHEENASRISELFTELSELRTKVEPVVREGVATAQVAWEKYGPMLEHLYDFAKNAASHGESPASILWKMAKQSLGVDVPPPPAPPKVGEQL